jgi:multiple sugar transport system substrate-binding protein
VLPWIWSFGGDITDPEITKATGYINGSQTVAAYEFLKTLLDKGYLHPGILGPGVDTAGGYAKDEIANLLEGPWMPAIFAAQFPQKEIHWALMPAGKGGSISVVGGEDIVIFQQSQHKEAALEFVRFMLSPETQLTMATVGQVPVRTDVVEQATKEQPYFAIFFEQLKTAKARLPHPNWPKIEDLLTSTGQAILRAEKSAKEALDELAPKVDSLLAVE